jgi:hypothetical protein
MLFDSAIIGPAAPSFHNAHESKTRKQGSKTSEQPDGQLIQPISATPGHLSIPCHRVQLPYSRIQPSSDRERRPLSVSQYIEFWLGLLEPALGKPSDGIAACLEENGRDNGRHAPEQDDAGARQAITHELHFASPKSKAPVASI